MNLQELFADPILFCGKLKIADKKGKLVRLKLNGEQIRVILALASGRDVLILKARQIGSSTAVAAYFFWKWLTATEPETYVVLSHKLASSKHLLDIHRRFYASLPRHLQRPLSVDNTTTLTFADTGATLMAASAEGKGGMRSFTATGLHISEYAFAPDAEELKATAISALNGGQLCIESTANYYGDALHTEIGLSDSGAVEWEFLFFPWTEHGEYISENVPLHFIPDADSLLSPGQQHWASSMSAKLGAEKFKREFPISVAEAYAQTEGAWCSSEDLKNMTVLELEKSGGVVDAVSINDKYAIGVDCGAGVGGDFSTLVVTSVSSGQIVEVRRSNTTPPAEWALQITDASKKWNGAKVLVESNGTFGGIIITELKYAGVPLWKDIDGKDWVTNAKTKPQMLEELRRQITTGMLHTLDSWTMSELRSFQTDEQGRAFCIPGPYGHGDTVIALALSLQCLKSLSRNRTPYLPLWVMKRKTQNAFKNCGKNDLRRY
jgi:hypothetical protein